MDKSKFAVVKEWHVTKAVVLPEVCENKIQNPLWDRICEEKKNNHQTPPSDSLYRKLMVITEKKQRVV